jgi:hypothetical protein
MFKWLVNKQLEAFGRRWGCDTGYVREIVDEAGVGAVSYGEWTSLECKLLTLNGALHFLRVPVRPQIEVSHAREGTHTPPRLVFVARVVRATQKP